MSEEFLNLRSLLHKSGLHYYTPACNRAAKDTLGWICCRALLAGAKRVILLHRHTLSDILEAILLLKSVTLSSFSTVILKLPFGRPVSTGRQPGCCQSGS